MQSSKLKPQFIEGPIFSRILLFALPIMMTGLLQHLYALADNVVVGRFSGDPNALAAVGSTGSFNNLVVNLFMGISTGCGVIAAQYYGAKRIKDLSRTVHTGLTSALLLGTFACIVGLIVARPMLTFMGTKEVVLDQATLYISIIFLGLPASAVYNFGAAILRAIGNSKTPLIILSCTGLANVLLNLYFVIVLKMSVAGVATATIIAQYLSAISVVVVLMRESDEYRFRFKQICVDKIIFTKMLCIGIPSGIQGSLFSISNMTIQSAVNTFPPTTVSGNTVGSQIEGFIYVAMNSFYHATLTMVGQNYGAGKMKRADRVLIYSLIQVVVTGIAVSTLCSIFANPLSALFVDTSESHAIEIITASALRTRIIMRTYFLCGIMEVLSGYLRGLGRSFVPMISSLIGACGMRILWVMFIFPLSAFNSPTGLYLVMPVSWTLTCLLHATTIFFTSRSLKKTHSELYQAPVYAKSEQ